MLKKIKDFIRDVKLRNSIQMLALDMLRTSKRLMTIKKSYLCHEIIRK